MSRQLSDQEIRLRLQEGRIYKRSYIQLKVSFDKLKTENRQLRVENTELRQTVATLKIQIAELQTIVFGKKKQPPGGAVAPPLDPLTETSSITRTAASYRRPIPPASAVT